MDDVLKDFSKEYHPLLKELFHDSEWGLELRRSGDHAVIRNREEISFAYELILKNVEGLPEQADGADILLGELSRDGDSYALSADLDRDEAEELEHMQLHFSDLEIRAWPVRANIRMMSRNPWEALGQLCYGIVRKEEVFPNLVNFAERALLPLMAEVSAICWWNPFQIARFDELRRILPRELHRYLEQMERTDNQWKRYWRHRDRLVNRLNRSQYEHIWLELWEKIAETQMGYPAREEANTELEEQITAALHRMGYEGAFPDFSRKGCIRKTRLLGRYLIRRGTNAAFHIRVSGSPCGDGVSLYCLCGTELLQDGKEPVGIERCAFRDGGRRFLVSMNAWNIAREELPARLRMAAKRAELEPLNRQDQKIEGGISNFKAILLMFLLFGGLFSVLYTLGMVLVSGVTAAIAGGMDALWEMVRAYPWLQMLGGTWLLSGIPFAVLMIIMLRE